jgi:hypothetical protein
VEEEKNKINFGKESYKWIKIVLIIFGIILFISGMLVGYILMDNGCSSHPFSYGINKVNKVNNAEFFCTCSSGETTFTFDKNGVELKGKEFNQILLLDN